MQNKIYEMLQSDDKEIKKLGIELAKQYFNLEDLKKLPSLNPKELKDICFGIDERIFLKTMGWD